MSFQTAEETSALRGVVMAAAAKTRREAIAKAAYRLAEKRGFAPGHELDDWLAAERQREAWERGCGRDPNWP